MTWSGAAVIEPGRLIYSGRLGAAHAHSHAAVQIAVASDGEVLFIDASGRGVRSRSGIIPSGTMHAVDAGSATGVMIYLDPTSSRGRRAEALVDHSLRADASAWRAASQDLPESLTLPGDLSTAADILIDRLLGPEVVADEQVSIHPGVTSAMALIPDLLGGSIRLTDIASAVHLSADRLGRMFARDVGLSFPAYIRWARLIRAMEVARNGGSITDAAHAAGFSDSSHANRAFHEMFGVAPVDVHGSVRVV